MICFLQGSIIMKNIQKAHLKALSCLFASRRFLKYESSVKLSHGKEERQPYD